MAANRPNSKNNLRIGSIRNQCSTPAHGRSSRNSRLLNEAVVCVEAANRRKEVNPLRCDIYKDQFQSAELFGKPVLYTRKQIQRETVPDGWHCYDLSGTDRNPDRPRLFRRTSLSLDCGNLLISSITESNTKTSSVLSVVLIRPSLIWNNFAN